MPMSLMTELDLLDVEQYRAWEEQKKLEKLKSPKARYEQ
jgi:hypothetical protein